MLDMLRKEEKKTMTPRTRSRIPASRMKTMTIARCIWDIIRTKSSVCGTLYVF